MKKRYLLVVLAGLLAFQGPASAEVLTGTIQGIDPAKGQFTLMRSDTKESVTVSVKNHSELSMLQAGSTISIDANKKLLGGWEAVSVAPAQAAAQEAASQTEKAPEAAPEENASAKVQF